MNVRKLILKLNCLFAKIGNRSQWVTFPIKDFAKRFYWAINPRAKHIEGHRLDDEHFEKGIFVLSLISVIWVATLCLLVSSDTPSQSSAQILPDFNLSVVTTPAPIDVGSNLQQMVLEAFSSQKVSDENSLEIRKEVLQFVETLENKTDDTLSARELTEKYNSLCMASLLLSKLSSGPGKQRLWSSIAIHHAEKALLALPKTTLTTLQFQKINLYRFLAMALNYYQRGAVTAEQVQSAFKQLDKHLLVQSGYGQTYLLQALAEDGIIVIPSYTRLKNS